MTTYTLNEFTNFVFLNSNLDRHTASVVASRYWKEGFDKNEAIKVLREIVSEEDWDYIEETGGPIEPEAETKVTEGWGKSMYGGWYLQYWDNGRVTCKRFETMAQLKAFAESENMDLTTRRFDNI